MMVDYILFLLCVALYQISLAGRDYMVTGILAEGLPPDGRFRAYVLWTSGEVIAVSGISGYLGTLSTGSILTGLLMLITILACWFGGLLDWIYFMIKGNIPEWNYKWHWMPYSPKTWQWIVWTCLWWIPIMICWIIRYVV